MSALLVAKSKLPEPNSQLVQKVLENAEGILRLAPTWVPRSFLMPGRRIKLHPDHIYAYGAHRGGIDERWFASTTPAANDNRELDEGLSYVVHEGKRVFTMAEAAFVDSDPEISLRVKSPK